MDLWLLPFLSIMYFFNSIDRVRMSFSYETLDIHCIHMRLEADMLHFTACRAI